MAIEIPIANRCGDRGDASKNQSDVGGSAIQTACYLDKSAMPNRRASRKALAVARPTRRKRGASPCFILLWRHCVLELCRKSSLNPISQGLAEALATTDLPIFARDRGTTTSHQFAFEAHRFRGGQAMAKLLRRANILSCGIGLPLPEVDGDVNGLRMGTPELVRWGMTADHMPRLAGYIADVLLGRSAPEVVASEVTEYRAQFQTLRFVR